MNEYKIALIKSVISPIYTSYFKIETWGVSVLIIENSGMASACMYWYNDDNTTIYLSSLNVNKNGRKNGIGTKLQEIRENIGRILSASNAILCVKINSWMHDWYKRRGYFDYQQHENDKLIWMIKTLKQINNEPTEKTIPKNTQA